MSLIYISLTVLLYIEFYFILLSLYPEDVDSEELNSLLTTIKNQGDEITELQKEVAKWQAKAEKETAAKKTAAKKVVVAKAS